MFQSEKSDLISLFRDVRKCYYLRLILGFLWPDLKKPSSGKHFSKTLKPYVMESDDYFEAEFQEFKDYSDIEEDDWLLHVKPFDFCTAPKSCSCKPSKFISLGSTAVKSFNGQAGKSAKRKRKNRYRGKWAAKPEIHHNLHDLMWCMNNNLEKPILSGKQIASDQFNVECTWPLFTATSDEEQDVSSGSDTFSGPS